MLVGLKNWRCGAFSRALPHGGRDGSGAIAGSDQRAEWSRSGPAFGVRGSGSVPQIFWGTWGWGAESSRSSWRSEESPLEKRPRKKWPSQGKGKEGSLTPVPGWTLLIWNWIRRAESIKTSGFVWARLDGHLTLCRHWWILRMKWRSFWVAFGLPCRVVSCNCRRKLFGKLFGTWKQWGEGRYGGQCNPWVSRDFLRRPLTNRRQKFTTLCWRRMWNLLVLFTSPGIADP